MNGIHNSKEGMIVVTRHLKGELGRKDRVSWGLIRNKEKLLYKMSIGRKVI